MKAALVALSIALTIPAVWAQRYPKKAANLTPDGPASLALKFRSLKVHPRAASPQAASAPAPLAVQVFVSPANGVLVSAYAIATAPIPAGSQITGAMTLLDDGSSIDFQQVPLQNALNVGDFISLPTISNFGDVWSPGAFDYTVQVVTARGATLQADGAFLIGETLGNADLASNEPVISFAAQSIASNKDVVMALPGFYTGDPVQVVMSDLFAVYVVPAGAIKVSGTEVDVDLSQVPGFDVNSDSTATMVDLDNLLVTVCDQNVCDTVAFRYVPPPAGSFNQAPVQ